MSNLTLPSLLIVEKDEKISNYLKVILEAEFNITILEAENISKSLEYYNDNNHILMIFCEYDKKNKTHLELYAENISKKNIPFVFLKTERLTPSDDFSFLQEDNKSNKILEKPFSREIIVDTVHAILNKTKNCSEAIAESNYKKVRIKYYSMLYKSPKDLFIQLPKGKILKIANKSNNDQKEIISHYINKGTEYISLKGSDFNLFLDEIADSENLEKISSNLFKPIDIIGFNYSISQEHLDQLNLSPLHAEVIGKTIETVIHEISSQKKIFVMIQKYFQTNNYLIDHSVLTIYFTSLILEKLGWSTEQTLKQLSYAAFFHDITIKNNELAKITNPDTINEATAKNKVLNHMAEAVELLEKLPGLNVDAIKIILDHHELPNGKGFPLGLDAFNIPPLSSIFIIGHHIIDFFIKENFNRTNLAEYIQFMEIEWCKGNFKRPFNCAREILFSD